MPSRLVGSDSFRKGGKVVLLNLTGSVTHWTKGRLQPGPMITRKIKINEVEEKGFETLTTDKDSHVKILVEVSL